jgi:hypothetical protein
MCYIRYGCTRYLSTPYVSCSLAFGFSISVEICSEFVPERQERRHGVRIRNTFLIFSPPFALSVHSARADAGLRFC